MKILVTGGAGFIGSHLADTLAIREHEVLVVDNLRTGTEANLHRALATGRVRLEVADILEGGAFTGLARSFAPEVVVHLAALVSVQEARSAPDENFRLNLAATQCVISAAHTCGTRRVILASSAAVYGDNLNIPLSETEPLSPLSLYGAAKAASELMLHASGRDLGFDTVALRFFNVFGLRQRPDSPYSGVISIFVDRAARGLPLTIYGDGNQSRDFISVEDVAAALCHAAEYSGSLGTSFNVCTGRRTTLLDVVAAIERCTGRRAVVEHHAARSGDIVHSGGCPEKLAKHTGFRAIRSFESTLQTLVDHAARPAQPSVHALPL